ncbi:hypothetical protein [Roseateles oligotrophus]|uniref:Excinuclease ABC subunit A n=1 Tax=Roseateles oligotrophus TaxID=1769250 RepID=A0ABT2YLV8_9BURK|nr:hypothetical protein [Roseateles oligotrophus]MCV2370921.1 hypothetical protein [Roseateles oligotrophus]
MKISKLLAALLLPCASLSFAAPVKYIIIDHSTAPWMDQAQAETIWLKTQSAKLIKLYPANKWGFLSQVEGGIDASKTCVITARTLMLPVKGKDLLFKPAKSATTFGSQANSTIEQCKALATAKLDEAVQALGSALVPN